MVTFFKVLKKAYGYFKSKEAIPVVKFSLEDLKAQLVKRKPFPLFRLPKFL